MNPKYPVKITPEQKLELKLILLKHRLKMKRLEKPKKSKFCLLTVLHDIEITCLKEKNYYQINIGRINFFACIFLSDVDIKRQFTKAYSNARYHVNMIHRSELTD